MLENDLQVGVQGWAFFLLAILGLLALDLVVLNRNAHKTTVREALFFSAIWISLALAFAGGLWVKAGPAPATQFLSGYLLELSLSVDNLFVFLLIFAAYKVPDQFLRKVLFWGILGAIVLRMLFIGLGAVAIAKAAWLLIVFGVFLVFTGFKLLLHKAGDSSKHTKEGLLVRVLRSFMPVSKANDSKGSFFVRQAGHWAATPLLLVVLVIEGSDVLFAVDSIPAVFGVTKDPFIVYTSNIFAILGLRSMFFALEGLMHMFRFLSKGLAVILVLIGLKLCFSHWVETGLGLQHVEFWVLGVVLLVLLASVALSVLIPVQEQASKPKAKLRSKKVGR